MCSWAKAAVQPIPVGRTVVRIDKETGNVIGQLDGYSLSLQSRRPPNSEAVFNGIAEDPSTGHGE